MPDPRIDPLGATAIFTDTQVRIAFAPLAPEAKIIALKVPVRKAKVDQMQSIMQLGTIHIQLKAWFAAERHLELSGPELMVLMEMADRFITELPRAQKAEPEDE